MSQAMTYMQALAVGWSIYWRQAVWTVLAVVMVTPMFHLARQSPDRHRMYVGIVLLLLAFCGVFFPRTILRVLQIRYIDFRLDPRRADSGTKVRFWEAATLSMLVNFVPVLAAPVLLLYVGAVPVLGRFAMVLFPRNSAMPRAAAS